MFTPYNREDFIRNDHFTGVNDFANLWERIEEYKKWADVNYWLANPTIRDAKDTDLSWFNILISKKIDSQDRTITKKQKFEEDLQKLVDGTDAPEDMSEEADVIYKQLQEEMKLKFLQLYFDCYMSPKLSDSLWRLGPVTGTVLDTAKTDELGTIVNGEMYTRSNFAIPYTREFIDNNSISSRREFYTTLFFPPFKVGLFPELDQNTLFMHRIKEDQPNIAFDQDNFRIRKNGFTYRDPGFKAINDNIIYLQWLAEGITGVTSTFLTEWDLSIYMQERMMTPMANGGPIHLFLNYRIYQDNPMAAVDSDYSTTEKALCFNVAGSAVSKVRFDCQAHWRPSDFPLAQWHLPYVAGRDYDIAFFEYYNGQLAMDIKMPYIDIYDRWDPDFTYEDKWSLRDIFRHQDYQGMIMGAHANFNSKYYEVFYSSDHEALTNFEVELEYMMSLIKGAPPGMPKEVGIDAGELAFLAKVEMLCNGGLNGKPDPAGLGTGYQGREEVKSALGMKYDDPGEWQHIMQKMEPFVDTGVLAHIAPHWSVHSGLGVHAGMSIVKDGDQKIRRGRSTDKRQKKSSHQAGLDAANRLIGAGDGQDVSPFEDFLRGMSGDPMNNDQAKAFLDAGLNMKPDASQMGKMTGINRYSPPIWGGPHSSDFSPITYRAWFQQDSKYLRNIPRISHLNNEYFTTKGYEDTIEDLNDFYHRDDEEKKSQTFHSGLKKLVQGLNTYVIDYKMGGQYKTDWVQGNVSWHYWWYNFSNFTFPNHTSQGYPITYTGEIEYRQRRITWAWHPWTYRNWYYNYYSYHNYYNSYYYGYWGGGWRYNLITYDVFRMGTYYEVGLVPYKKYVFEDMPDVKWNIIHHEFGDTQPPSFGWGWGWGWRYSWANPWGGWGAYYTSGYWGWNRYHRYNYRTWRHSSYWGWGGHWYQPREVQKKNAYVLKFYGDSDLENRFIRRMLNNDYHGKNEVSLLFLLGNEDNRYTQGPDAIFRAKCSVSYYWDACRSWGGWGRWGWRGGGYWGHRLGNWFGSWGRRGWGGNNHSWWGWNRGGWGWRGWGWGWWWPRFKKVYYISVDLTSIDFFEDNLQAPLFTNKYESGHDVPLHIKLIKNRYESAPYFDNIMNKFTNNHYDVVTAHIWYWSRWRWGWNWGWRGSGWNNWYYNWRGGWGSSWRYRGWGWGFWFNPIWWTSTATQGISGIGILSDMMGLDPDIEDSVEPNVAIYFRKHGALPDYSKDVPLKDLEFKFHTADQDYYHNDYYNYGNYYNNWGYNYGWNWGWYGGWNWNYRHFGWGYGYNHYYNRGWGWNWSYGWGWGNSWYSYYGHGYWGWPGYGHNVGYGYGYNSWGYGWHNGYYRYHNQYGYHHWTTNETTYTTTDMDDALKMTFIKMYTRALFKPEFVEEQPYSFISIDVPFRNFLSILQTQLPYYEIMKESIVETVDFEVMHNALFECVDKCVIKANGLTPDGEMIGADKDHPLYAYWTDMAVQLFGDKATHEKTKDELKTLVNNRIRMFKVAIQHFTSLVLRDPWEWTFNEICSAFDLLAEFKAVEPRDLIDNFMFAYLNILYNYRLYFICKRFNKEDGTMWIMRQLESILEFMVPFTDKHNPPPSPTRLQTKLISYKVAFYELQNNTTIKHEALMNEYELDDDRVNVVYVRVKWVDEKAYDKWIKYRDNPNQYVEVEEVVIIEHDGEIKYAEKPRDGMYQLFSKEWLNNDRDMKWNELHPNDPQRPVEDYDTAIWQIFWGNQDTLTPIRWNVFGTINVDNLIEYSKESISPEELLCLIEEGADFWTIRVPENQWPRNTGYKTDLKLRLYEAPNIKPSIRKDAYVTLLGPMAYSVYPITGKQDRAVPGVDGEVPEIWQQFMVGIDDYE